jgi:uncharacterized protein (TIGR03435 family)
MSTWRLGAFVVTWTMAVGPGVFNAVQEQLGLKLEPATFPFEAIAVESLERPKPD